MLRLYDSVKQFVGRSGVPLVGGRVYVFTNGTDDLARLYADADGVTPISNPMQLDSDGRTLGCFVDAGGLYRIEVNDASGAMQWTVYPVSPLGGSGGGGISGTNIVSTDGSISVDRTTVGSVTNYDIGLAPRDSDEFLEWVQCVNDDIESGNVYPAYASGSMETHAGQGLHVGKDKFYHVTSAFTVTPTGTGTNYETLTVSLRFDDGTGMTNLMIKQFDVDTSVSYKQNFEFACDFKAPSDGYLYWGVLVQPAAGSVRGVLQAHRIYSGVNAVPDTCATKQWVEEYYSEISRDTQADWTENDSSKLSYIRHRPDLSLYVTDSELETILSGYVTASDLQTGLATKQDTINDLSEIRSGAAAGSTALQRADVAAVAVSGDYDDLIHRPTIPSGAQLVPAATSADADKVLTVDAQGVPGWSDAQAPISAGDGINISNNVVSAKVDGTTVTINASGQLQASAPVTVDQTYDPTSTNPQSGTAVAGAVGGKQDVLTAGTGIDITGNTISCTATFTQQQADWAQTDTAAVDYIKSKPDLSVYATTSAMNTALAGKQDVLTAGTNVSISGSTISATDTTYSAGTGLDLTGTTFSVDSTTVAMKSDLPDLTDYVTDTELSTILEGYQAALTAGSNIQISNGTISATDTTYTAGTGLDLTGTEFSVDTTTIATKSDLSDYTPTASLAAVALSNDYDDLDNKPTIPVVPPTKELVAGNGITLTEGANDVTVACTVTVGTVTV